MPCNDFYLRLLQTLTLELPLTPFVSSSLFFYFFCPSSNLFLLCFLSLSPSHLISGEKMCSFTSLLVTLYVSVYSFLFHPQTVVRTRKVFYPLDNLSHGPSSSAHSTVSSCSSPSSSSSSSFPAASSSYSSPYFATSHLTSSSSSHLAASSSSSSASSLISSFLSNFFFTQNFFTQQTSTAPNTTGPGESDANLSDVNEMLLESAAKAAVKKRKSLHFFSHNFTSASPLTCQSSTCVKSTSSQLKCNIELDKQLHVSRGGKMNKFFVQMRKKNHLTDVALDDSHQWPHPSLPLVRRERNVKNVTKINLKFNSSTSSPTSFSSLPVQNVTSEGTLLDVPHSSGQNVTSRVKDTNRVFGDGPWGENSSVTSLGENNLHKNTCPVHSGNIVTDEGMSRFYFSLASIDPTGDFRE